ncbi:unnamed protein product [Closterium sp. NIES-54]
MATLSVLSFDAKGRPIQFDAWLDDLQLYLLSDSRDGVSLFDLTSGASLAPPDTADSATRSQWLIRDAAARLAVRNHLPLAERAHFGQHKFAKAMDLLLALDPTDLTVDLLEKHLLAVETSIDTIGASRGTPRTPFFEGCSPSPLVPSVVSAAAVDFLYAEEFAPVSTPRGRRRSGRGKGGQVVGVAAVEAVVGAVEAVEVAVVAVGVVVGVEALVTAVVAAMVAAVGVAAAAVVAAVVAVAGVVVAVWVELFRGEALAVASGSNSSV